MHHVLGSRGFVLSSPVLIGRNRDLEVPTDGRDVGSFGQEAVSLPELADDLFSRVAPALQRLTSCPHRGRTR
jgi:hypothetical protein